MLKPSLIRWSISFAVVSASLLVGQVNSPVTVNMTNPTSGQVVSNSITLLAEASSTMGPISKVEFYVDGVLVGTDYRSLQSPTNPRIIVQ